MFGASLAGEASADVRRIELSVQGMTCASCAARVEKKLNTLDGVLAMVNFATEKASVTAPARVPVHALIEEIRQAGYGAQEVGPASGAAGGQTADDARARYLRRRLIVALVFFVPLSDLSVLLSLFPAYRFAGWQWSWWCWPRRSRHGRSQGSR